MNIISLDYPGYGLHPERRFSESGCYRDIYQVYLYLTQKLNMQPESIILWGRSLGTGPVVHLAAQVGTQLGGVILESPFTSIIDVVTPLLRLVPRSKIFDNISKVGKIKVPLFIFHGEQDKIINVIHSENLSKRSPSLWALWTIPDGGHNNLESNTNHREGIIRWIKEYLRSLQ
jgi:fermentation-respiration switch protein FrsA (DUF1100 family)